MKYPFITVIGNIATGKSTISRLLARKLNAYLVKADEFCPEKHLVKIVQTSFSDIINHV